MQKENESWDSSFCSTHEVDISDEKLDFEADLPENASSSKEPSSSRAKEVSLEDRKVLVSDADVEEGEIEESSSVDESRVDAPRRCRFFEKGRCAFGSKCRFLHQSDKGLYSMFDGNRLAPRRVYSRPVRLKTETPLSSEEDVADWDRELKEAMLRVGYAGKKVPLDELNLTIRAPSVDEFPVLESKTSVRRVRYCGEEEPRRPVVRSREADRPPSPKYYRSSKRRYSDVSRSRSRSLSSAGRRFSCKCCRTPSPKLGRRRATYRRRPICCYRRRSVSSSSSSPVSRRHARDFVKDSRKRRASRPDRTQNRQLTGGGTASVMRDGESRAYKSRRGSAALAPSSPKADKIVGSSHKKSLSSAVHSSAKAASYSPDRRLSDLSISPYSSGSFSESENEPEMRRPSDMSISPFSDSSSQYSDWRDDETTCGAQNPPRVPRKYDSPAERIKNSVVERNPILPEVSIHETSASKKTLGKPSDISQEGSKSVCPSLEKRFKRDPVAEAKSSAIPQEIPKSNDSDPEKKLTNDGTKLNLPVAPRGKTKTEGSNPNKVAQNDAIEPMTSSKLQEIPKSMNPKKKPKNDVAEPKSSAHLPESDGSLPQKLFNHLVFDLMKYHKNGSSTTEEALTKVCPKPVAHRGANLSKKELLLKQLQEVTAAIERKKSQVKQNL